MEKRLNLSAWILASCLLTLGLPLSVAAQTASVPCASGNASAPSDQWGWPRQIESGGTTITIYQPQLDRWNGNQLSGRAAVAVQTAAAATPTYGVIWFSARTEVDKAAGTVTLADCQITKSSLPAAAGGAIYLPVIRQNFAAAVATMPLSQLEADLTVTQAEQRQRRQPLLNNPPRIIFSTTPAVLVLVDGRPALRQVAGTSLLRVINTRALILLDQSSGTYYLYLSNRWMQAPSLHGPWSPVSNPPASLDQAKQTEVAGQQVDLLNNLSPDVADALAKGIAPTIYVSTTSAELLETDGAPDFQPIDGTQLLWAKNSESSIFTDVTDQSYYVLVSGRWFRSKSLADGPWTYVPGTSLPHDFARIPTTHPAGDARPAVPGTPQAKQALIEQSIPQTATVRRAAAQLTVTYDGKPQFVRIEGTSLQRALNTPTPVIRVNGHTYYACNNGVWFRAHSPTGPWVIATSVPGVIYTIPVSCPINYVTHVAVYDYTPDVVYVGYTPGYLGTYIAPDNSIVFGSGYPYHSWIGNVWFGAPVTYGFGVSFDWQIGSGWEFGFGWGAGPWLAPWWGPWWGHWHDWDHGHPWWAHGGHWAGHPWDVGRYDVYHHWGTHVLVAHHFNPGGPRFSAHGFHPGGPRGLPPGGVRPAGSPLRRPVPGTLPRGGSNLFAGRDGRVYRPGPNGWQVHDSQGWHGIGTRNPAAGFRNAGAHDVQHGGPRLAPNTGVPGVQPGGSRIAGGESPAFLNREAAARSASAARAVPALPDVRMAGGGFGARPSPGIAAPRPSLPGPSVARGGFGGVHAGSFGGGVPGGFGGFGRRGGFGGGFGAARVGGFRGGFGGGGHFGGGHR